MSKMNETLLEMIYFFPMKEAFNYILGGKISAIYKPSPQKEAWVGFDQAWVSNEVSEDEFYKLIHGKSKNTKFLAYIIQFKIVEKKKYVKKNKRSFYIPSHYKGSYYRSLLKTEPSKTAPISQHDLLYEIKQRFKFLEVYYACPMLFSQAEDLFKEDFIKSEKKLKEHLIDRLILIDVGTAPNPNTLGPAGWSSYNRHHIMWQDDNANDMEWCSIPNKGEKLYCREWIKTLSQKMVNSDQLLEQLKEINYFRKATGSSKVLSKSIRETFSNLTILEMNDEHSNEKDG